uniref:Uncharacterized protein n=1 Tax=Rhizophagus irregularis (strain DAOM 181602 / DAOM 197198 / MUCL 43194) TaxID=747089 RepID=U9UUK9_RHIID
MTRSSDFTNFHYDTSLVTSFLTNESPSPLQASEWSSLVLVRFKVLAYWIVR